MKKKNNIILYATTIAYRIKKTRQIGIKNHLRPHRQKQRENSKVCRTLMCYIFGFECNCKIDSIDSFV
jgi:hypothetical protein